MSETLYRKYRPKHFSDIVGQRHIRVTLEHALTQDRLAHAYLFVGPRGVGKTTVARIVARAANCTDRGKNGEPCDKCASCTAMLNQRSLDLIEVDAASQTGVDNVRENIIQSARAIPSSGRFKVFIIDEVHMLSLAAFNALLKLLEEPPAHALFILATTEVHRIPDTIISRTQRFDFKKIPYADIATRLRDLAHREGRQLDDGVAERIARGADGSLRDAESMLGQLFSFAEKKITRDIADLVLPRSDERVILSLTEAIVRRQAAEALDIFHAYVNDGGDIPVLVHEMTIAGRTLLLAAVDAKQLGQVRAEEDPETLKRYLDLAGLVTDDFPIRFTEAFLRAERDLHRAMLAELPVEIAIITVINPAGPATPSESPVPAAPSRPAPLNPVSPENKPKGKTSGKAVTAEQAGAAWAKIQARQTASQPSLALSMKQAQVIGAAEGVVTIAVPFELHRQRLTNPKNYAAVVTELSEELGGVVDIRVTIDTSDAARAAPLAAVPAASAPANGDLWDQVVASLT